MGSFLYTLVEWCKQGVDSLKGSYFFSHPIARVITSHVQMFVYVTSTVSMLKVQAHLSRTLNGVWKYLQINLFPSNDVMGANRNFKIGSIFEICCATLSPELYSGIFCIARHTSSTTGHCSSSYPFDIWFVQRALNELRQTIWRRTQNNQMAREERTFDRAKGFPLMRKYI